MQLAAKLRSIQSIALAEIIDRSTEKWDQKDGRFPDVFPYIEISKVGLGTNEYEVLNAETREAPSRARLIVRADDIIVSLTRPNRGAIAKIRLEDDGAIASTGFAILRHLRRADLSKDYLTLALSSSFALKQMIMRSSGGNYPAITGDELDKILIPLPKEAHDRIVEEMNNALAERRRKLEVANTLLTSLDDFLFGVLKLIPPQTPKVTFAIRARALTSVMNPDRYRGLQLEKQLHLKNTVDVAGTLIEERCSPEKEAPDDEWDWIRIDDLPNRPWQVETVRTEFGRNISGAFFEVHENDILIARLGPTILNSKFVLCPQLVRRTVASPEFLVIRCRTGWEPEVVLCLLRTRLYREVMYARCRGATPSRFRLDGDDLLGIPFPEIDSATQEIITAEVRHRRVEALRLQAEAEEGWKFAKQWFEEQLFGGGQA